MRKLLTILAIMLISISATAANTVENKNEKTTGEEIVESAMKYIGTPYRSGRMNPKSGFDCSGFTSFIFKKQDILLPHSSRMQYSTETAISDRSELQKGDLVFFSGSRVSSRIGHVGIVTDVDSNGNFSFIHASCSSGVIVSSSTEAYYAKRYIGACRVIEA